MQRPAETTGPSALPGVTTTVFVRWGHLFGQALDIISLRGSTINTTRVTSSAKMNTRMSATITPDYANGTAIPQALDGVPTALKAFQDQLGAYPKNTLAAAAQLTLQMMYGIDQLGIPSTAPVAQFASINVTTALKVLIAQMKGTSDSIQGATVSAGAQTAVGTPIGTPIIVVSVKDPQGFTLQTPFAETLLFTCTQDSQSGSATAGNETVTLTGAPAAPDVWSHLYPAGSAANIPLSAVDGSKYLGATNNLLNNSGWSAFSLANYPDNWVILTGLAGTTVFDGSGIGYDANLKSLKLTGDVGGTLISVAQPFSTTPSTATGVGGTSTVLTQNQTVHLNLWIRTSSTPSAGVLTFDLVDGSNTVLVDDAGNNLAFTKSLTAVSTSWVNVNGSFHLPSVLPTTTPPVKLRITTSTAIDSTKSVYLSRLSMATAIPAYNRGPLCTVHSGATRMIAGLTPDAWTVAISNSFATTGSGLMALMLERVFGLRDKFLQFPYDPSPTVADSLIA